jgi:hypothetical protein
MSTQPDGALEMKVAPPATNELPSDLNQLGLELFRSAVDSDPSLPEEWKQAILAATTDGIPGDILSVEALLDSGCAK